MKEGAVPIYDKDIQNELMDFINLQLQDNVKARLFDQSMRNAYVANSGKKIRCQHDFYNYLQNK